MATAIQSPLGTIYRVTREELDRMLAERGIKEKAPAVPAAEAINTHEGASK